MSSKLQNMNTDYLKLAYERTILVTLQRQLEEEYLQSTGGIKQELVCEEVPYTNRIVTAEAFVNVIQRLQSSVDALEKEMAQYDYRRKEPEPLREPAPARREQGKAIGSLLNRKTRST